MLRFLFPRLTSDGRRGQQLFDAAVAEARKAHWYREGGVPDTIDGRFAMLATVCALLTVRIEELPNGLAASAALSERFIEAMDAEHRQLGMNDPALGRAVRKMVGSLARRVDMWRPPISGEGCWDAAARSSVFGTAASEDCEAVHVDQQLRQLWQRIEAAPAAALSEGRF